MRLLKRHGYDSRTGAPHTKQNAMLQPEGAMDAKRNRGILYEGAQLKQETDAVDRGLDRVYPF